MATMISGLGGVAGYGEQSFRSAAITGTLDDGFTAVNITSVFGAEGLNINGTAYQSVFISSNGLVTFQSGVTTPSGTNLSSLAQPAIAPFWTDTDITRGGDIYWDLDPGTGRLTITWVNVAAKTGPGTNSFQVVITATGGGDASIDYIYQNIGYTAGTTTQATAGFWTGTTQTLVPGSGNATALSNYATANFGTNDPSGVFGYGLEAGVGFVGDGVVEGTAGNDSIFFGYFGDPDGDRIDAGDTTGLGGTTGNGDYIDAGAGDDSVGGHFGSDVIFGGAGRDSLQGGYGGDTIDGGTENDTLDGGSGNDSLIGGAGNDTLIGGSAGAAINYTPSYFEVTNPTQQLIGSGERPNFSVRSVSSDGTLGTGFNGALSGFRVGNLAATETHTHTASSPISGGQVLFNGLDTGEAITIQIDGVTIDLNTAIANGTITFNGGGVYGINASGQIVRTSGTTANPTTVGTLTVNIPYTSLAVGASGPAIITGNSGFTYEYYVNTQASNVAAESGGNDSLFGGDGSDSLSGGDGNDLLDGGIGNDSILTGAGDDTVFGGDGDDTIDDAPGVNTLVGNDIIYGGQGNDLILDGSGNDSFYGGLGNDSLWGDSAGDDFYDGAEGNDSLFGGAGNDTLLGGVGADSLSGGAGADYLDGGDGADTLIGNEANDTLIGGGGDDSLVGGSAGNSLDGGTGNDTVFAGYGNDTAVGGEGDDTLQGWVGNDALYGGDGQDSLIGDGDTGRSNLITNGDFEGDLTGWTVLNPTGATGPATYVGGSPASRVAALNFQNEPFYGDGIQQQIQTAPGEVYDLSMWMGELGSSVGDHTVVVSVLDASGTVVESRTYVINNGTSQNLTFSFTATTATSTIRFINTNSTNTVSSDVAIDNVSVVARSALVWDDSLYGGAGNDLLFGGFGADLLDGGAGDDSLTGGDGDDTFLLTGALGNDTVVGGEAAEGAGDVLDLSGLTGNITLTMTGAEAGTLTDGTSTTTFSQIERIVLGNANVTLFGSSGNDSVEGGAGNDSLSGGAGNDTLSGGGGNDTLAGGTDADLLRGGDGDDTFALLGVFGNDTIIGGETGEILGDIVDAAGLTANTTLTFTGAEAGTLTDGASTASFSEIERFALGSGNDTANGGLGTESIDGGAGNDSLSGAAGNDSLAGGSGNDSLYGGADRDSLSGGIGNDLLDGGDGNDTLLGDDGDDLALGGAGNDVVFGGVGNDSLQPGVGDDLVYGGAGDDWFNADLGNDTIYGDDGNDVTTFVNDGDDLIFGGAGNDFLSGGAGNDTISGDAGDDVVLGGDGDDTVSLGADFGQDNILGGEATETQGDHIDATALTGNVTLTLVGAETGTISDGTSTASFSEIERIALGSGNDTVFGGAGNDAVSAGGGDDSLIGADGNDLLDGGSGNDLLFGGDGADTITAGIGNDSIFGGSFGDVVDGGENAGDLDQLDLSNWGWRQTNILYDSMNPESGVVEFLDLSGAVVGSMTFSNIERIIPCFTPGTRITTRKGEVLVEDLKAGDEVLTRDNGFRPLIWTGCRALTLAELVVNPALRPVRIAAGALGSGLPVRDMLVSPQHRMLIEGYRAEMLFGESEVLVAARHLMDLPGVETAFSPGVTYIHVMFDQHEIICADGSWTESFLPAQTMLDSMDVEQAEEIRTLFPELNCADIAFPASRLSLKAYEARVLLAA